MSTPSKCYAVLLHASLLALIGLSLALAWQNHALRSTLTAKAAPARAGHTVGPIDVASLTGEHRTLSWNPTGRDRLLLVFTTTCSACEDNQRNWQTLARHLGDRFEIIGISLDDLDATHTYRDAHDLSFEVVAATDTDRFLADYEISAVPFTLHVGSNGTVLGAWRGGLSPNQVTEMASSMLNGSGPT